MLRRVISGLLLLVALVVAGTVTVFWHEGYRVYAVRTGSMTPSYSPGDLVLDRPSTGPVSVGDVVTFRSFGGVAPVTTHRVAAVHGTRLTTKGDANRTPDIDLVPQSGVVGRVVARVPKGGYVLRLLSRPAGVAAVMTSLLGLTLLWGLFFPAAPAASRTSRRESRAVIPSAG